MKPSFNNYKWLCIIIAIFVLSSTATADEWPVKESGEDFGHRQKNYCDYFGKYHGYHSGIDISADSLTSSFHLVRSGKIVRIIRWFTGVWNVYCWVSGTPDSIVDLYVHIDSALVLEDSTYSAGTLIGYPERGITPHLHFAVVDGSDTLPVTKPIQNPLELAVLDVDPDTTRLPEIDSIVVRDDDGSGSGVIDTTNMPVLIDGQIDIITQCKDFSPVVSDGDTLYCGVYQLSYTIKNVTHGNGIAQSEIKLLDQNTFKSECPHDFTPSVSCSTIYSLVDPACNPAYHIWWYKVTNKRSDGVIHPDGCWNTMQHKDYPDSNATTIDDAKFPDGIYQVLIKAADHEGNWSDTTTANSKMQVHVDNFKPRVKETRPTDWFAFVPHHEKRVWCIFSEAMDTGQETRLSGYQRIREFKNYNFQINTIFNTKLCSSFYRIICTLNRVYDTYTINQRKRRY
jgi:hypothetical protein